MTPRQWVDHNQHGSTASDALLAVDAIRAVLDLHEPQPRRAYGTTVCVSCSDDEGFTFMEYPCPTVRTVADALGADL